MFYMYREYPEFDLETQLKLPEKVMIQVRFFVCFEY